MEVKTLKGRPVGLKAYMSEEQMLIELNKRIEEWKKEGFNETEIYNALWSKVRPLLYGYYWRKYPEACQRLKNVWFKYFNNAVKVKVSIKKKPINTNVKETKDFLNQF